MIRARHALVAAAVFVAGFAPDVGMADGALCDRAAAMAAAETGVPLRVLLAVTRTETGRRDGDDVLPWPWAANMAGESLWYASASEAERRLTQSAAMGRRNFDVGCFQLNYRWHGEAFPDLGAMLDPVANARYAARFLLELHEEFGAWDAAVGAYHSRTPHFAARYLARYRALFAALEGDGNGVPARSEARGRTTDPGPLPQRSRPPLQVQARPGPVWAAAARPLLSREVRPLWEQGR